MPCDPDSDLTMPEHDTPHQPPITELNLHDVPALSSGMRYYDGEIFFADNITSVPKLMKVFKVKFVAFVFVLAGELRVGLDNDLHTVRCHEALFVDTSRVVTLEGFSDDFSCKVCAFTADVGFNFVSKSLFDALMRIHDHPVIHFADNEVELLMRYYALADYKMSQPSLSRDKESMANILRAYAYDLLLSVADHVGAEQTLAGGQGARLFRRFMSLMATNPSAARSVKEVAQQLCVSPKYLTSVCRQHAGKSAGELIAASIATRIKQLLLYSDMSVKEVAVEMGFTNLSFFGKYVKKHLGQSPAHFRRHNHYGV